MTALTSKYQPKKIAEFAGLHRPKRIMQRFISDPHSDAFLLYGGAGLGKTTFALAVADELGCTKDRLNLIHVAAAECTVEKVRWIRDITESAPTDFSPGWYGISTGVPTGLVVRATTRLTRPACIAEYGSSSGGKHETVQSSHKPSPGNLPVREHAGNLAGLR